MSRRATTCWSLLLATGMACLGHASAAEPMSERTYRASDVFNAFLNSAEYAGIEGDCGKSLKSVLDMLGVEWPDGASIRCPDDMYFCRVVNTSANLAKIDALIEEFSVEEATIEVEVCFVEACRAALDAVGYFDTNRVDAAVLKERLRTARMRLCAYVRQSNHRTSRCARQGPLWTSRRLWTALAR